MEKKTITNQVMMKAAVAMTIAASAAWSNKIRIRNNIKIESYVIWD